ncbi:MAG: hypothetical protein B7733_25410 [Myxococcales bacterium FL481]|nr:MAG: hypothetical protein B7733_25410 [Myxococcales bacterium FL481]
MNNAGCALHPGRGSQSGVPMPMLADLDDPPRPRWKNIVAGFLIATPVTLVAWQWLLPQVHDSVRGGSEDFDKRLRLEDAYMRAVCEQALVLDRDEQLCKCVFAAEYPSLDCQAPFQQWTLARQVDQCADPTTRKAALSFCTCVDVIAEQVQAAVRDAMETGDDELGAARRAAQNYHRCQPLPDAINLPGIEALTPATE